jgi:hypothetical protein
MSKNLAVHLPAFDPSQQFPPITLCQMLPNGKASMHSDVLDHVSAIPWIG